MGKVHRMLCSWWYCLKLFLWKSATRFGVWERVCLWLCLLSAPSRWLSAASLEVQEWFLCLNKFVSFCFGLENVYLHVFMVCLFADITWLRDLQVPSSGRVALSFVSFRQMHQFFSLSWNTFLMECILFCRICLWPSPKGAAVTTFQRNIRSIHEPNKWWRGRFASSSCSCCW